MFISLTKSGSKKKLPLKAGRRMLYNGHCKQQDPIESTRCTAVCSHARAHCWRESERKRQKEKEKYIYIYVKYI